MTRLSTLIALLPFLVAFTDATPIHRSSHSGIGLSRRNAAPKKCHRKHTGDKPKWADYAAHAPDQSGDGQLAGIEDAWRGWKGQYVDGSTVRQGAITPDGDAIEEQPQGNQVESSTTASPAPTESTSEAPSIPPTPTQEAPTPSPTPSTTTQESESTPTPEPQPEPSPEPDNSSGGGYDPNQPCMKGEGEHEGECLRNVPVPHPNIKAPPAYPTGTSQQDWIDAHNMARDMYGQAHVGWSEGAYAQAKANVEGHAADGCKMEHTKDG